MVARIWRRVPVTVGMAYPTTEERREASMAPSACSFVGKIFCTGGPLALKILLTVTFTVLLASILVARPAYAEDEDYEYEEVTTGLPLFISALGLTTLGNETDINGMILDGDAGWAVAGSAGLRLNDYVIYELLSVEYGKSEFEYGNFTTLTLISDFRFGVFNDSLPVNPYVLVGLGATRLDLPLPGAEGILFDTSDWSLAWQLGAGVTYSVSRGVSVGIAYRYTRSKSSNSDHRMPDFDWVVDFHSLGVEINFVKTFFE